MKCWHSLHSGPIRRKEPSLGINEHQNGPKIWQLYFSNIVFLVHSRTFTQTGITLSEPMNRLYIFFLKCYHPLSWFPNNFLRNWTINFSHAQHPQRDFAIKVRFKDHDIIEIYKAPSKQNWEGSIPHDWCKGWLDDFNLEKYLLFENKSLMSIKEQLSSINASHDELLNTTDII